MDIKINSQTRDILDTKGNLLIQASAGTGKTTVLLHKIDQLLAEGKENLLVLTFSNAAVNEVKQRIKDKGYFLSGVSVFTFHRFCWNIIQENIELTPYKKVPSVLDESSALYHKTRLIKEILEEKENTYPEKEIFQSLISYANSGFNANQNSFFISIFDKGVSLPNFKDWLANSVSAYANITPVEIYKTAKLIEEIVLELNDRYSKFKIENLKIDFSDMEIYAYNLLSNKGILDFYKNMYEYVLVDEYQDTSYLQESILFSLERNNIFCVGDLKQAIYGFRNATPEILQNRFSLYSNSQKGTNKYLTANYRSSENIVNFVNDIFINPNDNSGFFTDEAKLIYGRDINEPGKTPVEIKLVSSDKNDSVIENTQEIINTIKSLIGQPIFVSEENTIRPCKYSDILVLSPRLVSYKNTLCKEFQKNRIPYTISQKTNLLKEIEIQNLISVFKLLTFKTDADFINFFHKGFLGLSDNDLMEIKNIDLKSSLYNNVLLSTNNKFDYFKTLFDNVDGDFFKVATKLIISTNFYQYVKSMSSPEIAEENVNEFIFWMNELSLENPSWTMTDFLLYIDDLNINKIQVKSPNISFEDAVEISTIHSVKGAASSIVILAFTDSRIIANKPQISFNANLGFGIKYYDTQKRTLGTTPFKEQIDDLNAKNDESEEFRLLYVALTRARDRLFIIGKGDAKSINNSLLGFILNNLQDQNIPKSSLFDIRNVRLNF